jgi:pimeloyl-ACP methyl ester carboxylesterase
VRVDEHTIELDGSPAFYRRASTPAVPPLYLHGVPTSSDDWVPFLERTGGIAPDLIGFGRSGKGGNLDYSLLGLTDFVVRLLAELGVERVSLVGHDWGAAVGLMLAQRRPARVERLVVCNAVPLLDGFRWHGPARLWRLPAVGELLMGSITRRLLARTLRSGCVNPDAWPDARVATVWDQFDQGTQRAILRLHRSADERALAAAGGGLASIDAPALVVWGERDPWLPASFADAYAAKLPHATAERVAGAGHWPWLDQPALVDRIAAFVEGGS